jgi:hypothetical protein
MDPDLTKLVRKFYLDPTFGSLNGGYVNKYFFKIYNIIIKKLFNFGKVF